MGPRLSTGGNPPSGGAVVRSRARRFNGAPSLDGGEHDLHRRQHRRGWLASMGPRLSTGGNGAPRPLRGRSSAGFNGAPSLDGGEPRCTASKMRSFLMLQWGPVSRRGGTVPSVPRDPQGQLLQWGPVSRRGGTSRTTSRAPRHLTLQWGPVSRRGGTSACHILRPRMLSLQWGPVSRRGGTSASRRRRRLRSRGFNGAPSLDGGERVSYSTNSTTGLAASMGPRLSTGGNQIRVTAGATGNVR